MKTYQVIKFLDGNLTLDVNISPEEETVWLSKEDIAQLLIEIGQLSASTSTTFLKRVNYLKRSHVKILSIR